MNPPPAEPSSPASARRLRLAMCNVQNGIGTTRGYWQYAVTAWKYRFPHGSGPIRRAAAFLRDEQVDLAALVEIGGGARRTRGVNQVALLAQAADLPHAVFFPALIHRDRLNQGNAICTRFPLQAVHNHPLPGTGEPRFLSEAAVTAFDLSIRVFVTHLSLQRPLRVPQIQHIADLIGEEDRPTILAGDFNISEEAELDLLIESNLQKVTSAPTFPSWRPIRPLDHLFFSRHFKVLSSHTFDAFLFSDHLPLVTDIVLHAAESAGAA